MRKQYIEAGGVPILGRTLMVFDACEAIADIVLAIPPEDMAYCRQSILNPLHIRKTVHLVPGGEERQDSVYNALRAMVDLYPQADLDFQMVAIHDGVRPFVQTGAIAESLERAQKTGACVLGIPAFDTVKEVNEEGRIQKTLPRERMWLAQTPQSFRFRMILAAHEAARRDGHRGTDDASLAERLGKPVAMMPGDRNNIKITTPEDLRLAEALLRMDSLP